LEQLKEGVIEYEEDTVIEYANRRFGRRRTSPWKPSWTVWRPAWRSSAILYEKNEYFVPEVLDVRRCPVYRVWIFCAPTCPRSEDGVNAQVVIGSIQGDVHDIGKNLVKMMFDVAGWDVHDLGRDVPLENFVEEQLRTDSEVVAMSAMMTTTMLGMKKVIAMIKEKNPNVAIMLGGAPVTKDVANLFGADGYAESAGNAVSKVSR
jgi:methanogenic corrinoid protein MtbC1